MASGIRLRTGIAVVSDGKILLVPHYATDAGPVQWVIPGGGVEFGETLEHAAEREFFEETGFQVKITGLFDVSQVILPEKPWHSVTITFSGEVTSGELKPEVGHRFGDKMPRCYSMEDLRDLEIHPREMILKALRNGVVA
jgi:8-oxo-dGTP diphosphatase